MFRVVLKFHRYYRSECQGGSSDETVVWLLRISFRTKWPWPIKALSLRVISCGTDCYVIAGLRLSHALKVYDPVRFRRTGVRYARDCQARDSRQY